MFSSPLRSLPQLGRRWKPLNFSNPNFVRIPEWHKIEEETLPDYIASQYYPTRIGEVIKERYQIIGKLGFGSTSTVWLARDIDLRLGFIYRPTIVSNGLSRSRRDKNDKHQCLIYPPLWESVWAFLHRNLVERLPSPVLVVVLYRLFLALDYLYTECHILDIKANNIIFGIKDDSVFTDFEENLKYLNKSAYQSFTILVRLYIVISITWYLSNLRSTEYLRFRIYTKAVPYLEAKTPNLKDTRAEPILPR
ncbi:hypothetical protein N7501_006240 [Penicillium viridicatum]|nr:hypothetical protein N7501_006240 [Penicillium viridicatum]